MKELGVKVDVILGGRTKDFIILEDEIESFSDNVYYATNDGSKGIKGFVTDQFNRLQQDDEKYDLVIAIGPLVMMKAVCELTKKLNIETNVSLNPLMIE